jgi:hypothetical protein
MLYGTRQIMVCTAVGGTIACKGGMLKLTLSGRQAALEQRRLAGAELLVQSLAVTGRQQVCMWYVHDPGTVC